MYAKKQGPDPQVIAHREAMARAAMEQQVLARANYEQPPAPVMGEQPPGNSSNGAVTPNVATRPAPQPHASGPALPATSAPGGLPGPSLMSRPAPTTPRSPAPFDGISRRNRSDLEAVQQQFTAPAAGGARDFSNTDWVNHRVEIPAIRSDMSPRARQQIEAAQQRISSGQPMTPAEKFLMQSQMDALATPIPDRSQFSQQELERLGTSMGNMHEYTTHPNAEDNWRILAEQGRFLGDSRAGGPVFAQGGNQGGNQGNQGGGGEPRTTEEQAQGGRNRPPSYSEAVQQQVQQRQEAVMQIPEFQQLQQAVSALQGREPTPEEMAQLEQLEQAVMRSQAFQRFELLVRDTTGQGLLQQVASA